MPEATRQDLIDLLRATTDEDGWLNPLLADLDSETVINALADIFARVSLAAQRGCDSGSISLAPGGRRGTTNVTISRTGTPAFAGTLVAGTSFVDQRGVQFVLKSDVVIPSGDFVNTVVVESLRKTELVNTPDDPDMRFAPVFQVSDATNATPIVVKTTVPHSYISGDIVRVREVTGNLAANDIFDITVVSETEFILNGSVGNGFYLGGGFVQLAPFGVQIDLADPVTNGASDWLSLLGEERGQKRQDFETDGQYRLRIRNIPESITPRAVAEAVQQGAQDLIGTGVVTLEPFDDGASADIKDPIRLSFFETCYISDGSETSLPESQAGVFFDDSSCEIISNREARAYFRIETDGIPSDPDLARMFFEDAFFDDPVWGYPDVVEHPSIFPALFSVIEEADRKRAAGVQFDFFINADTLVEGVGSTDVAAPFPVFTLTPPVGKNWIFLMGIVSADSTPGGIESISGYQHSVKFTFDDASTFTTTPHADPTSELLSVFALAEQGFFLNKRVTEIEGRLVSDGVNTTNLVGSFWVIEADAV